MKQLRVFFARLSGLLPNSRQDLDRADEIEANLQLHVDDNIRQGMTPDQARRVAMLKLGGFQPVKEAYRDQATLPLFENLIRDIGFAVRQLRKNAGFTCTAVLMLALGVCASVAIFAFADAALLKPLPYKDPKHLVGVYEKIEKVCPLCNLSYLDYLDWKQQNTVFSAFDVYNRQHLMLKTLSGSQQAFASRVSAGFFRTLGVQPALGRDFRPGEDQLSAPRTVILSYSAWQKNYGGAADVLGKHVILNDDATVIIGVLPRGFHFAPSEPTDYWVTLHPEGDCDLRRSCHSLFGVGRLKDGVSFQTALTDVTAIASRLERQYPLSNKEQGANLSPLSEVISGNIRPILLVLLAGACLLLLIAAVNIASLLLVRTESRMRELAIRSGLGASAGRITAQFIAEGLVLVAMGSVLGLACACWAMQILTHLLPADMLLSMPFLNDLGLSPRVLAFAGTIAFLAAVLFSFTPMLSFSLSQIRQRMSEGSRGSSGTSWRRLGSKLVVVELATAVVLLAGAGLLGQSLYRLLTVKLGLQPDHLVMINMAAPNANYSKDPQAIALERKVLAGIAALPGVKSVGIATKPPVTYQGNTTWFKIVGRPWHGEHNDTPCISVSLDYFRTIGATLLRGRDFNEADDLNKPLVAVVNQSFARQFFPNENPLGKRLTPLSDPVVPTEIVGVVEDIKEGPPESQTRPTLYYPFPQNTDTNFTVLARTAGAESSVIPAMAAVIHGIDSGIVTMPGRTMTEQISRATYLRRSLALLAGGFAALALLLGVIGLYGVISYSVGQRTREIGVRMALGAERVSVYRLILKDAGGLIGLGLVMGVLGSISAAHLMESQLFEVSSWDVPTLGAVALVLSLSALLASFIPARRAASVNPLEALRAE
jgi:predicted permease